MNDPEVLLEQSLAHSASLGVEGHISYSRVMSVRATDTEGAVNLLPLAKKRAIDPTVFDEVAPFFFGGEATNMQWDSYDTRQGISSLKNYAQDFTRGVAYLIGHNNRGMSLGGTLTGTFDQQSSNKATVRSDVYMIQDPEAQTFIQRVRAGIIKDQSIGFYPGENGQYICSICNKDMLRWMDADGCSHWLGMMYTPTDKSGKPKEGAAPVKARATIEDHHVAELSGVFDGATPGAMIDKARSMAQQGQMDGRTREFVQVRYNIKLPSGSRVFPTSERKVQMTEEEIARMVAENVRLQAENTRLTGLVDAQAQRATEITAVVEPVLPTDHAGRANTTVAVRWLAEERARLIPLAEDGRAYREDLIEQAVLEGKRAMGAEFQIDLYTPVLQASGIPVIKRMRDDWKVVADKTFPKGRQTQDPETPVLPKPVDIASRQPAAAFRG